MKGLFIDYLVKLSSIMIGIKFICYMLEILMMAHGLFDYLIEFLKNSKQKSFILVVSDSFYLPLLNNDFKQLVVTYRELLNKDTTLTNVLCSQLNLF